jgi:hypothetical protein
MKFFLLDDPARPADFACFSHVGTWTPGRVCEACGQSTAELIEPLQIKWNEGTERIGDFSWCGYTCIVTNKARRVLVDSGFESEFGRVEVMLPTKRAKMPRVPFPYLGPTLSWLIPSKRLPLNVERSGVGLISDCSRCGQKRYAFKRAGLIIDARDWSGEKLFRVEQFCKSGAIFVTEPGLDTLTKQKFSNLHPLFAGTIERA